MKCSVCSRKEGAQKWCEIQFPNKQSKNKHHVCENLIHRVACISVMLDDVDDGKDEVVVKDNRQHWGLPKMNS